MSNSYGYASGSGSRDILPTHATRRFTRRDALLPLILVLELLVGVAFGMASHLG